MEKQNELICPKCNNGQKMTEDFFQDSAGKHYYYRCPECNTKKYIKKSKCANIESDTETSKDPTLFTNQ